MTSIKLTVNGAKASAKVDGILTSGSVGIPVTIQYDNAWDGLTKNLVCTSGKLGPTGNPRAILNIDTAAAVAQEALIGDEHLYLGVEGQNSDGSLVIHTVWADCGKVFPGANGNADPSAESALPIWRQLQTDINTLKRSVGTHGGYYVPEVLQSDSKSIEFRFQSSANSMPAVNPVKVVLPDSGANQSGGITDNARVLLISILRSGIYSSDQSSAISALESTLHGSCEDSGGSSEAEVTLSSISSTYSGGDVAVGTAITDLTGIVVTAHYSDGSSEAVTGYTLSGMIAEGANTITVTYQGKTTTFTVTGVAESGGGDNTSGDILEGVNWTDSLRANSAGEWTNQTSWYGSDLIACSPGDVITFALKDGVSGAKSVEIACYDSTQARIKNVGGGGNVAHNNATYASSLDFTVPDGVAYIRVSIQKTNSELVVYVTATKA